MSSDGIQSTFSNVLLYLQVCLGIWQFIKLTPVGALIKGVFGWLLRPLGLSTTYSRLQDCPGLDGRVFKRANCFELQADIPAERRDIERDQDNSIDLNYLGSNFVLERKKEKEEDGDTLYVGPKIKYYITEMIWKELQNLEQVLRYGQDGPPFARAAVTKAAAVRLQAQYEDAKVEAQRAKVEAQRADAVAQRAEAEAQPVEWDNAYYNVIYGGDDAEAQRAHAEAQRAHAEAQRADAVAQRADAEAQRAEWDSAYYNVTYGGDDVEAQPVKWDSAYYNVTYGVPSEAATDARAAAANYALTADDYVGPSTTDAALAPRMAAEFARRKAAEYVEARRKAAEFARRKAAESVEARRKAAEFARRKAAESVEARRKAVAYVEARHKAAESARSTADSVQNAAASRATLFVKGRKDFWKARITGGVMTFVEVMDAIILYNQHVSVRLSNDLLLPINLSVSEERLLKIVNLVAVFLQTKKVVKVHWSIPTALSIISALLEFSTTIRARLYSKINVVFCSIMHLMCDPLPRSWRRQVYTLGKWVENLTPSNDIQLKVVRGNMCAIITEGAKVDKEGAIHVPWCQGPLTPLHGVIETIFHCEEIGSDISCTFVPESKLCEISAPDITDISEFYVKCKDEVEFRRIITLVQLMAEKCCGSLISYGPNNKVRVRGFEQSVTFFVDNGFPPVYTLDLENVIVA